MTEATGMTLKKAAAMRKRRLYKKYAFSVMLAGLFLTTFCYWRYLDRLTHVRVPAKASRSAAAHTAPVADKSKPAPQPDAQPATAKTGDQVQASNQVPAKVSTVGFADSLMSVLLPSAHAETIQPVMPPARKPTPRVEIDTATVTAPVLELPPLTAAQKRWQVAQDGFAAVMSLAVKYPDPYGFRPDEDLEAARLGDPIPIYTIAPQGSLNYLGQPLESLFQPADEWIFPIILGHHIRYMLQVRQDGEDYVPVPGHGSRALAMVYDRILARWPASAGFHPQLVILPNLPGYYFTVPELPGQNITDACRMFDLKPCLSPASVILAGWR
jgi:hypothetical protein